MEKLIKGQFGYRFSWGITISDEVFKYLAYN